MYMRATTFCMVPRAALVAMILLQSISILVSLTPSKTGEFCLVCEQFALSSVRSTVRCACDRGCRAIH